MLPIDKKDTDLNRPEIEPNIIQKAVKVIAWPLAAVSGIFYSHKYARNATYDRLKSKGEFKVALDEKDKAYEALKTGGRPVELVKADGSTATVIVHNVQGKQREIEKQFEKNVNKIFRASGYRYTPHYIKDLGTIQQIEAGVAFLSAASIALGVAFAIADSKALGRLKLNQGDAQTAQTQTQR
jgi:hypothetical protein